MRFSLKGFGLSLAAICALLLTSAANAATELATTEQVKVLIEYVPPIDPKHEALSKWLKEREALERMQMVLSPFRLSFSVTLRLKGCDGVRNAWYDPHDQSVTICYEYLQDVVENAPAKTTPDGVTREDAIIGPMTEVFLHEFAHMLFRQYKTPLLGPEEDSADSVAAYTMMQFGPKLARSLIGGVALMYGRKVKEQAKDLNTMTYYLAQAHPLTQSRFNTLLCYAYGGEPKNFADVVDKGYLPKERAAQCHDDYERIKYAMQTLFRPHIDTAKWNQVRAYFEKK
jgi:hypothetical protein